MEIDIEKDPKSEVEVLDEALERWPSSPATQVSFNPIEQVPAKDLILLIRQVEKSLAHTPNLSGEMDVLAVAASVMLLWEECERVHSTEGEISLVGLSRKGRELFPGKEVVVQFSRTSLEASFSNQKPPRLN